MELEGQEGQEGQEAPQAPPTLDPKQVLELAAQQYGVTPDYLDGALRLQDENRRVADENKRRQRELEVQQIKLDALSSERQRYAPPEPTYTDLDPFSRTLMERLDKIDRRFDEDRQRREQQEIMAAEAREKGEELHGHFESLMRRVPTQNQLDAQRFFGSMAELWPDGPPQGITPEKAVDITARYLGLSANGAAQSYTRQTVSRDPRAQYVIPGGGGMGSMNAAPNMADDGPQRQGESLEAYSQRLAKVLDERAVKGLRDGTRVSSG